MSNLHVRKSTWLSWPKLCPPLRMNPKADPKADPESWTWPGSAPEFSVQTSLECLDFPDCEAHLTVSSFLILEKKSENWIDINCRLPALHAWFKNP